MIDSPARTMNLAEEPSPARSPGCAGFPEPIVYSHSSLATSRGMEGTMSWPGGLVTARASIC